MRLSLVLVTSVAVSMGMISIQAGAKPEDAPKEYLDKANPFAGKPDAIEKGKKLYEKRCQKCHGEAGDGKGKSATDLNPEVTAFSAPGYLAGRKDGQLYWITDKGSVNTDMDAYGPGTSYNHSEDDIWAMIAYIRSKFTK